MLCINLYGYIKIYLDMWFRDMNWAGLDVRDCVEKTVVSRVAASIALSNELEISSRVLGLPLICV
jgi:hypothetical protein